MLAVLKDLLVVVVCLAVAAPVAIWLYGSVTLLVDSVGGMMAGAALGLVTGAVVGSTLAGLLNEVLDND